MTLQVAVLVSGEGTNLQALLKYQDLNLLPLKVVCVFSDQPECGGIQKAREYDIPVVSQTFQSGQVREEYDREVISLLQEYQPDLVLLLGYMRIVTQPFIQAFPEMLNLHPALPGAFPGSQALEMAYQAFQKGKVHQTGAMVHRVIEEIDAGEVIDSVTVPFLEGESFESISQRVKQAEKPLLLGALNKYIRQRETPQRTHSSTVVTSGKVRDRFDLGYNLICFFHSDRLSSFDRHICHIPGKGNLLNMINRWWMERTTHIVPNHLLYASGDYLVARKCEVIPLEFIVRAYITGSTSTSLWTHYRKGVRNYCGVDFPDGLQKNQRLSEPVLTPTTKGEVDELISYQEILNRSILTREELDLIYSKALELFRFGSQTVAEKGLILVDTKYEFGRLPNGQIVLIDEIHTCDSSRFWKADTYEILFNKGEEPQKLDKDSVRDYVKSVCDPYHEPIPEIPEEKKLSVLKCYQTFYQLLTGEELPRREPNGEIYTQVDNNSVLQDYFRDHHQNTVVILSGSEKDAKHINKLKAGLASSHLYCEDHVCSAHKKTRQLLTILEKYNSYQSQGRNVIYVTVAGRSNALSGVVACNTSFPVIACPPFGDKVDMTVNIHSTLQMPSNVPTMTILEPGNVALCCERMFNLH